MPDRVLPGDVQRSLSAALEAGAPLTAPLPSQSRFARLRAAAMPAPRWRFRALTTAVAFAGIVAVAFAAPPQPRSWIVQSVGHIAHDVGVPDAATSPSPEVRESPEPKESPEAHQSNEPAGSPEAHETAEPSGSSDGDHAEPSPTAQPSDGHDGGDDHSPQPSPSSGD